LIVHLFFLVTNLLGLDQKVIGAIADIAFQSFAITRCWFTY